MRLSKAGIREMQAAHQGVYRTASVPKRADVHILQRGGDIVVATIGGGGSKTSPLHYHLLYICPANFATKNCNNTVQNNFFLQKH